VDPKRLAKFLMEDIPPGVYLVLVHKLSLFVIPAEAGIQNPLK